MLDGTFTISPRAPLSVPDGGTSATTPAGALVNLQVPMGTIEQVNAGAGLSGGGNVGAIDLAIDVPLGISLGGTNALNATQARTNLGAAPLASPVFTGVPQSSAPPAADNSNRIATTAWVTAEMAAGGGGTITGVAAGTGLSGGGTSGNVTLTLVMPVDLTGATTPTAATGTSTTALASTAFVQQEIASLAAGGGLGTITGVTAGSGLSGGGTSGNVTLSLEDPLILDAGTY